MTAYARLRTVLSGALRCSAAAVLLVALATPAAARAAGSAGFEEYADRVGEALEVATELEPDAARRETAHEMAVRVNDLLPGTERVLVGDRAVQVDNSVLRGLVATLDAADTAELRRERAGQVVGHLASLDASVARASGEPPPSDPEALAELLEEQRERDRSTLQQLLRELAERFNAWLAERLAAFGVPAAGVAVRVVVWLLVAALAVSAVWLLVRAFRVLGRMRERRVVRVEEPAGIGPVVEAAEGLPRDVLGHADGLAAAGRFRDAVRALFGGAARALVEEGVVRQTRTLTNAELIEETRPGLPAATGSLGDLSRMFELAWYGHVDPGRRGFESARERYREAIAAIDGRRRAVREGPA